MREEELGGLLQAFHGRTCRNIYVEVNTEASMSQEQYRQLMNVMLRECGSLTKLVLRFTTKQSKLSPLEFVRRLEDRETFPELEFFEVAGVDAPCMVEPLGVKWVRGINRVKGTWNGRKWELEGDFLRL